MDKSIISTIASVITENPNIFLEDAPAVKEVGGNEYTGTVTTAADRYTNELRKQQPNARRMVKEVQKLIVQCVDILKDDEDELERFLLLIKSVVPQDARTLTSYFKMNETPS